VTRCFVVCPRRFLAGISFFLLSHSGVSAQPDIHEFLKQHLSPDGACLARGELIHYFKKDDPTFQALLKKKCPREVLDALAESWTDAVLSGVRFYHPDSQCDGLSLEKDPRALDYAEQLISGLAKIDAMTRVCPKQSTDKPQSVWDRFTLKRELTDSSDPRQKKIQLPAVVWYLRDASTSPRDQITAIGAVGYEVYRREFGSDAQHTLTIAPTIDADVEGTQKPEETSVEGGVTVSGAFFVNQTFLETLFVDVTPTFGTDRTFDREVYSFAAAFTPSSKGLRMGFKNPGPIPWSWQFRLDVSYGKVADAAGSADLQKVKNAGAYFRAIPRLTFRCWPLSSLSGVSVALTGMLTHDLTNHWGRAYAEAQVLADLNPTGSIALTAAFRRGEKAPTFKDKNQVLVGIGLKK